MTNFHNEGCHRNALKRWYRKLHRMLVDTSTDPWMRHEALSAFLWRLRFGSRRKNKDYHALRTVVRQLRCDAAKYAANDGHSRQTAEQYRRARAYAT